MTKGYSPYCGLFHGPIAKKITLSGLPNHLNYCIIFIADTHFTNVAAGRIIQPGGPRVEDSCYRKLTTMTSEWSSVTQVS